MDGSKEEEEELDFVIFHRQMLDFAHIRHICMKVACAYVFKLQWYVEDLRSGSLQFEGNSVWLDSPIVFQI